MKNKALFFSKDKSKKLKCLLLQFLQPVCEKLMIAQASKGLMVYMGIANDCS